MAKGIKNAFLILRVEESFKLRVEKAAQAAEETVSDFIRKALTERM